jgi:phenylalanyl-tRNA synthetase beta subunit
MTERTDVWREIFSELIQDNGYYEKGKVNFYNLASILEDLYAENAELKARVEALEKDKEEWFHPESSVASNKIDFEGCYD